jgi:DhnA family fructose-bisphosphate aldolase class Ia
MIVGIVGAETVVPELLKQILLTSQKRGGFDLGAEIGNNWEQHRYNADWLEEGNAKDTIVADAIEVSGNWTVLPKMYEVISKRLEGKVDELWAHCSHCYPSGANIYFIVFATGKDREDTLKKYNEIWEIVMEGALKAGGSKISDEEAEKMVEAAVTAGTTGLVFGRNIFQADDSAKTLERFRNIVHGK